MGEPEADLARPPGGPGPPAPPGTRDDGPPDDVMTARLVGGGLTDGLIMEIEPGAQTLEIGPPLILFGPAFDALPTAERERLERGRSVYRYVGVEAVENPAETHEGPRRAVFQFADPDQ